MLIETFKTRLDETVEKLFGKNINYNFNISLNRYDIENDKTEYTNKLYINIEDKVSISLEDYSYSNMFITALRMLNTYKPSTRNRKNKSVEVEPDTHTDSQFGE